MYNAWKNHQTLKKILHKGTEHNRTIQKMIIDTQHFINTATYNILWRINHIYIAKLLKNPRTPLKQIHQTTIHTPPSTPTQQTHIDKSFHQNTPIRNNTRNRPLYIPKPLKPYYNPSHYPNAHDDCWPRTLPPIQLPIPPNKMGTCQINDVLL